MRTVLPLLIISLTAAAGPNTPDLHPRTLHSLGEVREIGNERAKANYPVRLEGAVTYSDPEWGLLFVQDKTGSLYIDAHKLGRTFAPGTGVRVTGVTAPGDLTPVVAHRGYRVRALGYA